MSKKLSKERVQRILNGGSEPVFSAEDMATDEAKDRVLNRGLYFYRQSFSQNDAKEWIADWLTAKGRGEDAKLVSRASKSNLRLVSPYCRMESRGFPFNADQQAMIQKYMDQLLTEARSNAPAEDAVPNIQERLRAKADETLSELEPLLDETFTGVAGKRYKPVIAAWIASKDMTRPTAIIVRDRLEVVINEVTAAYSNSDPDLAEGYSYLKRPALKRVVEIFEEAVAALNQKISGMKGTRKPRKPRKVNPEKLVKGLKYLPKDAKFGFTSVDPRGIVGAQGLIVFNTKNNKATMFLAAEPKVGLSVKGSTVIGWNTERSYEKTVRKPEQWLKQSSGFGGMNKSLEEVKTKSATPTGRINKHCLLVRIF